MKTRDYKKQFNPGKIFKPKNASDNLGDKRFAPVYVFTDEIILAVNVALVTNRPLLIRGPSGTGKSTLARSVADFFSWPFYEEVITSDTQSNDLMWKIDYLSRLHDAQSGKNEIAKKIENYIIPGPLWWAFERESALEQANLVKSETNEKAGTKGQGNDKRSIVLIDEIDKANPDVPNNLLVTMGSLFFNIKELDRDIYAKETAAPLIFITTNEERDLPKPLLRRCLEIRMQYPSLNRMIDIAEAHFPDDMERKEIEEIIGFILDFTNPKERENSIEVSQAEILDAIKAYKELKIKVNSDSWKLMLSNIGFIKKGN